MPRPDRSFGPAIGEPPVFVDPRRWGALIGVAGGLAFVFGYAPALGTVASVGARLASLGLAVTVLVAHFVRPTALGPFREPARAALLVYVACVVGELAAIAVGSRLLTHLGREDLRPALIAGVVGVHFVPFAWTFGERMFLHLGGALIALGVVGVTAGYAGVTHAAQIAAVLSGLLMLALLARHAGGRYAHTAR